MERKSFTVAFIKDKVEISEKSRSVQVSVSVEEALVRWLIEKLKSLRSAEPKQGHLGSRKGKDLDVILNVKKNIGGFFLSLLGFDFFLFKKVQMHVYSKSF